MLGAQLFNATLNFLRSFRKNCRLIRGFSDHFAAHELNRAVARGQVQALSTPLARSFALVPTADTRLARFCAAVRTQLGHKTQCLESETCGNRERIESTESTRYGRGERI